MQSLHARGAGGLAPDLVVHLIPARRAEALRLYELLAPWNAAQLFPNRAQSISTGRRGKRPLVGVHMCGTMRGAMRPAEGLNAADGWLRRLRRARSASHQTRPTDELSFSRAAPKWHRSEGAAQGGRDPCARPGPLHRRY